MSLLPRLTNLFPARNDGSPVPGDRPRRGAGTAQSATGGPSSVSHARRSPPRTLRTRRVLAAVCFALASALALWILTPSIEGTEVVVAAADLAPGSQLARADLTLRTFPTDLVPDRTFTEVDDVIGHRTSAGVSAGSPLTRPAVIDQQALPQGSTDLIMPVRLADDASAALVSPGQRIRLFSALADGGTEVVVPTATIARLLEEDAELAGRSGLLISVILSEGEAERVAQFAGLPISFAILPG